MRDNTFPETHFRYVSIKCCISCSLFVFLFSVSIVSESFSGKPLIQRHRMVFDLFKEEMTTGGLHALNLFTKTPAEAEKSGWELPVMTKSDH